ncbi:hypothetical protein COOONC_13672 [Cooperia oncophora]
MPEKTRQQRFHEGPPFIEMRTFSSNGNLASNLYNAPEEENESSFLFGWPWLDRQIADDNSRIQKRRSGENELSWNPLTPDYFVYSGATSVWRWSVTVILALIVTEY